MQLLMKMGWKPGMGIGKNMNGSLEPLTLDIKQDRRGLVAVEELPASVMKPEKGTFGKLIGRKHPITLLAELCNKRRWGAAQYACTDSGPTHMKRFLWKVVVNGVEYQPAVPARNKKDGKLQAAQVCLQSIGVLPKDSKFSAVIG